MGGKKTSSFLPYLIIGKTFLFMVAIDLNM